MIDQLHQLEYFLGRDNLVSLLLLALLLCIFIILFLIQKLLSRKTEKIKKNQLKPVLKEFFNNQIFQTQNTGRHRKRKHFDKKSMQLRYAYLAIEKSALDRGIDSEAYWNLINSKLKKLLSIYENHQSDGLIKQIGANIKSIRTLLNDSPESPAKEQVYTALAHLQNACKVNKNNPKRLQEINNKLMRLLNKFNNEFARESSYMADADNRYIDASNNPVQKIKENAAQISELASKGENWEKDSDNKALTSLSEKSDRMKQHIRELEEQLIAAQYRLTAHSSSAPTEQDNLKADTRNEIHDISEEIIEASEREIDRLSGLLREKKVIIQDLESSLRDAKNTSSLLENSEDDTSELVTEKAKELDLLRRNLLESEQCIVLLEKELETLKTNLAEAKTLKNTPINEQEIENLNHTIKSLKDEVGEYESAWKEKHALVNYVLECLDAATTEDVSLSIYQCLLEMGFTADMLIYTPARTLEINEIGAIPHKVKLLVDSMQIGEANLSENERKLNFRWKYLGGSIVKQDESAVSSKEKENLIELSRLTDKILHRLIAPPNKKQNHRSMESISNAVKYLTKELDDTFEQVFKKVDGKIHDGFGQLQDIARSSGMQAGQIASIKNLENSTADEIKAEKRAKLRVHKSMLSLLDKIEALDD